LLPGRDCDFLARATILCDVLLVPQGRRLRRPPLLTCRGVETAIFLPAVAATIVNGVGSEDCCGPYEVS